MEWVIESYDRGTDRDGENRFATEVAFIEAGEDLLRNNRRGFVSATLPDGTIVRDEGALRALSRLAISTARIWRRRSSVSQRLRRIA